MLLNYKNAHEDVEISEMSEKFKLHKLNKEKVIGGGRRPPRDLPQEYYKLESLTKNLLESTNSMNNSLIADKNNITN
jgi:hypothetical protein